MKAPQLDWMLLVNEALEGSGQNSDSESEDDNFVPSKKPVDAKNGTSNIDGKEYNDDDLRLNFLNPAYLGNKMQVHSSGLPRKTDDHSPMTMQTSRHVTSSDQ